jgi:thioredoxin reductase (NADPH)
MNTSIETDALIIGAGPVGLFQVFQLGLLEIKAHVVDSLPHAGGQCVELYADKPIYDIPAITRCTGQELVDRLLAQVQPFGATFHLGQEVTTLAKRDDGRFDVSTSTGTAFVAKTVFVAGGVGSFQPRSVKVDGIGAHVGTQLFYQPKPTNGFKGQHVVVLGAGDAALEAACAFTEETEFRPARVTLVHRRDVFQADDALIARMQAHRDSGALTFQAAQITGSGEVDGRLATLQVMDAEGALSDLPADAVFAFLGVSPKLGPLANWGLALERKQVVVDTEKFETAIPGLFAVGDVNTYAGKKKLILCGFHEATLAAYGALAYVFPDKRVQLQYTTTSPRLHALLGVSNTSTH